MVGGTSAAPESVAPSFPLSDAIVDEDIMPQPANATVEASRVTRKMLRKGVMAVSSRDRSVE